jgi:hypothetical protein
MSLPAVIPARQPGGACFSVPQRYARRCRVTEAPARVPALHAEACATPTASPKLC